ncbi:restriction endonuclease subunit S [Streptococcus suis]|uniref:Type I restriction modification DNA specificity protein n=2 Tax=Streptococcus suis TaxID=1307 RepID=A0AB33U2G8_STRSU|nr:restriction endonuclease subunit S [Streptococcus suis]MDW8767885.1 restriction endonuclease subunit S [Streptococcus suis]NQH61430.1 restriction endonuclease subunit S [Streptococcus suis]NQH85854.1 restriction endonuclease subunit S [Streptococcus suis]NQN16622.1 restriction endonuclease subunit S [Streptococcus suis]NQR71208.1 restriction endonuclease subunit S [Streptococcus suis]
MTRMKDSGIEWIGEMPEEWGIKPIKHIFGAIGSGTTPDSSKVEYYDGNINWLQSGDLYKKDYVYAVSKTITDLGYRSSASLRIYQAPFLAIAMYGASIGNLAISKIDACVNQAVAVLKGEENIVRFTKLALEISKTELIFAAQGGTQPNINQVLIKNWVIPFPSEIEIKKIADFLDKKVAQLDKVKSLLEEQIKTLEDYRQSLIYETVTKGLDKTVPLKDSGVDWIGQIPEGWEIGRLKDFVKFQTGTTPPQSVGVNQDESGVPWFKPGDFSDNSIDLLSSENHITHEVVMQYNLSVYPKKTILLVGIASIGKVGYSAQPSYSNQQITALRTIGEIYPRYLAYLMFSSGRFIKETALYTVVPIINNQYLATMRLVLPSENEQKIIVEYLDRKLEQINQMIAIKKEQIENINKQRQTLIYDYVTGKRRV